MILGQEAVAVQLGKKEGKHESLLVFAAYAEATVIPSLDVHHVNVRLLRGSAVDCFKSECPSEVSAF